MILARSGRVGRASGYPCICDGIVSTAAVIIRERPAAPYDHLTASPDCGVMNPGSRRVSDAGGCPRIVDARTWSSCWCRSCTGCWCWQTELRTVSAAGVEKASAESTPNDHFSASPHGCVKGSIKRRVGRTGWGPGVPGRIVSAAGVEIVWEVLSAPDDHFAASPHGCMRVSGRGRIRGGGGCPTIRVRIISAAGVQRVNTVATPDDHFTAAPHCRVTKSARGRIGYGRSCPAICAGIISSASI